MEKKNVLLLGDSIRISYQPIVAGLLAPCADIYGTMDENNTFSLYTLTRLERWIRTLGLDDKTIDVVHWNNGIHDCGVNPNRRPAQFSVEDYAGNLRLIIGVLRKYDVKQIIFATTTPAHDSYPQYTDKWSWKPEYFTIYNAAACKVMEEEGIPVNDLYSIVNADQDRFLADDKLHLSIDGKLACSGAVAKMIKKYL